MFYEAEHARVYRAVYAICGNHDVAEESTQEAFSRALARWRRLRREGWAGAWVTTVAVNACKRNAKRMHTDEPNPAVGHPQEIADTRHDLVTALRTLPPRQREVVVLHYLADYPVTVVAHVMNISEGTVKTHLSRARDALRRLLERADA